MIPRRLRSFALMLPMAAFFGCATIPTDYAGEDAGKVVIGIGAAKGTGYSHYALLIRDPTKRDAPAGQKAIASFAFYQNNMWYGQDLDYKNELETGVVLVKSLPPGQYEIYNFDIYLNTGVAESQFSSREDFSVPFTVSPGQTTYLGNFQANGIKGKNMFGMTVPHGGAVFAVSNRAQRELTIARSKDPKVSLDAIAEPPDAAAFQNVFFVDPVAPAADD